MPFADLYGQDAVKKSLQQSLRLKKLPPSLLFSGSDGEGMRQAALILAQALNCFEAQDDACGRCSACQAIAKGNFPDVIEVGGEKKKNKKSIGVEETRELRQLAMMRPMVGRCRVFLINEAEMMTMEAANSLLKILEEPPGFSYFILITTNLDLILPTIQSRCRLFYFSPLSPQEIEKALLANGVAPERAKLTALLAEGSIERAFSLDWDKIMEQRRRAWEFFCQLNFERATGFTEMMGSLRTERQKKELEATLRLFLTFYRDLLLLKQKGEESLLLNVDLTADLKELSSRISPAFCLKGVELTEETLTGLQRNLNPRLLAVYFSAQLRRFGRG